MTTVSLSQQDIRLRKWATYASISTALILVLFKFVAYLLTGSVSLLSSLLDSTMDAFASLVMMIGVLQASQPADADHRFGHGKFEALASLTQAMFITGSAVFLIFESVHRLATPVLVYNSAIGISVMLFSIALTLSLLGFQRYVIRKTGSMAIGADSLHYAGDLVANFAVIVVFAVSRYSKWPYYDPIIAIAIAGVLVRGAWKIAKQSIDILADRELSQAQRDRISEIVLANPKVLGMHDLRTRTSGLSDFIEMHIELEGAMTVADAHLISESIEKELYTEFPAAEVMIHQDPHGIEEVRLDDMIGES